MSTIFNSSSNSMFETGKIYSAGKLIYHTPLKYIKCIEREENHLLVEDITGRQFYATIYDDHNHEIIYVSCASYVMPQAIYASDEASAHECNFTIDNFSSTYYPSDVTYEKCLNFFDKYLNIDLKSIEDINKITIYNDDLGTTEVINFKVKENVSLTSGKVIDHDIEYYYQDNLLGVTFGAEEHDCLSNNVLNFNSIQQEIKRLLMIKEENESMNKDNNISLNKEANTKAAIEEERIKILQQYNVGNKLTISIPCTASNGMSGHYVLNIEPCYFGKFQYSYFIEYGNFYKCIAIKNTWADIKSKVDLSVKKQLMTKYPKLVDFIHKYNF